MCLVGTSYKIVQNLNIGIGMPKNVQHHQGGAMSVAHRFSPRGELTLDSLLSHMPINT